MSAIENVFWGVIAGIITSALLFLAGLFVAKILLPWYQNLVYQGVDLRGLWVEDRTEPDGAHYRYPFAIRLIK